MSDWSNPEGQHHDYGYGAGSQPHSQGSYPPAAPMQYGAPYVPAGMQPQRGNGLAVASLVLGITCIVFSWWGLLTLAQVALAIIFGSIGISRANQGADKKGLAVAGLVLGSIGLVIYFFIGLFSLGVGWLI